MLTGFQQTNTACWFALTTFFAVSAGMMAEACKAPPDLQALARSTPDGSGYGDLGTWFGQHNQFACANEAFRASLKLNPASAKVSYFLGFSLYSSGERSAALTELQRSAELDSAALQPRVLAATILDELHRRPEAETQWRSVLALDPVSSDALDGLSKDLIADHDYLGTIELLRNTSGDEDLTLDLASAFGQAGMLEEAAAAVEQARTASPNSIRLTKALATVYVHQHRYQDATKLMHDFLQQHPSDQESEVQYLSMLVLTHDFATARPLGKKLLTATPHDFDVLYLNGILEREAEDYPAAREHLLEAVSLRPDDYTVRFNLGAVLARLDQPDAARQQLERAISLEPLQQEAHFQLAAVLRTLKQTAAAQEQVRLFQELKKESAGRSEADSKSEQARRALAAGDLVQAVDLYRQAVSATPGNALLHYQFAMALDKAGDTAGEQTALEQATKIDPTFALAANQLGFLVSHAGDSAAAESNFRQAVRSAPAFTGAWINLAATLAAESKFSEAEQAVTTALQLDPRNAQALELSRQLATAAHR